MNDISWFLYFVDISQNSVGIAVIGIAFLFTAMVVLWIRGAMIKEDSYEKDDPNWKLGSTLQRNGLKLLIPIVVLAIFSCLVPSKQTLYMIAASQVGEEILKLEDIGGDIGALSKDALTLLRQNIQEQIAK